MRPDRARFFFLEVSKVGNQHISLINGYLKAIAASSLIKDAFDVIVLCHDSLHAELSPEISHAFRHENIPVMDPNARRFVPKILLEVWVVLRTILRSRKNDIIFISCLLPTALWIIEGLNKLLPRRHMFVTLHGEVEAFYDQQKHSFKNYGYWSERWMRLRSPSSQLNLVVLDSFIRDRLTTDFPHKIKDEKTFTIHHPITPLEYQADTTVSRQRACFIGYRTKFKGYAIFESFAREVTSIDFVTIGGGTFERLPHGNTTSLDEHGGYLPAIANCAVAIFPYIGGYTASLSAAALDALSAGVHIIATERSFFVNLAKQFGPDMITICQDNNEIKALLENSSWVTRQRDLQSARLARLLTSPYSISRVCADFEKLFKSTRVNYVSNTPHSHTNKL